jgi:hypothetical protein
MAAFLGGGGGSDDLSELLGGGSASPDLSALLGGGGAEALETPAAPEPEATPESAEEDALAALTGGGSGATGDLLSKLLGSSLVQTESDIQMDVPKSEA